MTGHQNLKQLSSQTNSVLQNSIHQLISCQQILIQCLESALKINKELILSSLVSVCFPGSITGLQALSTLQERNQAQQRNQDLQRLDSNNRQHEETIKIRRKLRIKKKRANYDTKNIPKNFGTAIHIFIKRNSTKVKTLLAKKKISYSQFYEFNKAAKERINSLIHLRELWQNKEDDAEQNLKECYRIISFQFLRKFCLSYIFGSRIKNISSHVRYRKKLLEGIEKPHNLFSLKDY